MLFIITTELWFPPDMKRIFVLSTFICFAMICACQKQDSAAEAQLAQRKTELDARAKALDEREKAIVEKENAVGNHRIIPSRRQARNPAEIEAEKEKRLQQVPPEVRALIPSREQMNAARLRKQRETAVQGQTPDPEQAKAEREKRIQELPPELQALARDRSLSNPRTAEKATATPNPESSDTQPGSPSPSPTP
jgi:FtsZ-interacting cell division protein ZipA